MAITLKAGVSGLALLTIAGAGVLVWQGSEPNSQTVAESGDSDYSGKFGEDFKHHMVSFKSGLNENWWTWSFKNRWEVDKNESKDTNFQTISDGAALKNACEAAYKKSTKSDIHGSGKEAYEKSIWRYCSLEGQKPITVKDAKDKSEEGSSDTGSEKIGKKNEGRLISTLAPENSKFWKIQEQAFFKSGDKAGLGNAASQSSVFETLYEKTNRDSSDSLRLTCQEVYKKEESKSTQDKEYAFLFCSLQPKEN